MSKSKSKKDVPLEERRERPRLQPYKRPSDHEWERFIMESDDMIPEIFLGSDGMFYFEDNDFVLHGPYDDEEQAEYALMRWANGE